MLFRENFASDGCCDTRAVMTGVTSAVRMGRVSQDPSWRPLHDRPSWRLMCRRLNGYTARSASCLV